MMRIVFLLMVLLFSSTPLQAWGFYAHKLINSQAIFSLPPELMVFFKPHQGYLREKAVNPDRRRYAVKGEAEKHFIDLDVYGDSALQILPQYWPEAVALIGEDSLRQSGIAPWSTYLTFLQLVRAFEQKDTEVILRLAADLGHYLGDIHVPLHTTKNYNGQFTGQYGIHGFWESRLPELYAESYNFFVGKAEYISDPQQVIWRTIAQSHAALDSVLGFEAMLNDRFPADKKYSFEERGGINTRVYSRAFSEAYHRMLAGQVERQMRQTIKLIADFWYSAWILAGQPDFGKDAPFIEQDPEESDSIFIPKGPSLKVWQHETSLTSPPKRFWKNSGRYVYCGPAFRKYFERRPRFLPAA
ncbi:zinc dependent phospholipase C family protein [Cyclobacterium roseum]|uniref:zinc dependent phospholipase C family protein n=1 Tax=Cyclobacterium roseum TaxID=2666137 RepID=UPI00139112BE|nr:zinc dependent phospholipase C family protein [Cyclobacterium roseum]